MHNNVAILHAAGQCARVVVYPDRRKGGRLWQPDEDVGVPVAGERREPHPARAAGDEVLRLSRVTRRCARAGDRPRVRVRATPLQRDRRHVRTEQLHTVESNVVGVTPRGENADDDLGHEHARGDGEHSTRNTVRRCDTQVRKVHKAAVGIDVRVVSCGRVIALRRRGPSRRPRMVGFDTHDSPDSSRPTMTITAGCNRRISGTHRGAPYLRPLNVDVVQKPKL